MDGQSQSPGPARRVATRRPATSLAVLMTVDRRGLPNIGQPTYLPAPGRLRGGLVSRPGRRLEDHRDLGEPQRVEHAVHHPAGVGPGLGDQRAVPGRVADLLLGQLVHGLLAVRVAGEEVADPVQQALLLGEHVGLLDVQHRRLELRGRQLHGHRRAVRRDLHVLALQAGKVDERDVGALPEEQRLAALEETRQERGVLGQVDDDLERSAGRLVPAQRGDRLQQHGLAAVGSGLGERVAQLRQQVHRGRDEGRHGHGHHGGDHPAEAAGGPAGADYAGHFRSSAGMARAAAWPGTSRAACMYPARGQ